MRRLTNPLRNRARDAVKRIAQAIVEHPELKRTRDMMTEASWQQKAEANGNPLLRRGAKFYSQNDEDGIINAIAERIGLTRGVFVEFGCGDGLENNTIHLLMQGWSGAWIDSTNLKIRIPAHCKVLTFEQEWVTQENCVELVRRALPRIGAEQPNVVSLDLDGNDWFVTQALLAAGYVPDLFIVEYNGKFPPPIRFQIEYESHRTWAGGDYWGASLQSYVDLLEAAGFRLVCCNITGANAFFVAGRHAYLFHDVPNDVDKLFVRPDYNWFVQCGHATDPRSIERFL